MENLYKLLAFASAVLAMLVLNGCGQNVEQVEQIEEVDEPDLIDESLDANDLIPRPLDELGDTDFVIETSPGLFVDGNKALRHKEVIDDYGVLTPQYDKDISGFNLRIVSALLDEVFKSEIKIELSFHAIPSGKSTPRNCTDYTRWECQEYKKWKYWTESAVREWMKPFKNESSRITDNIVVGTNLSGEALNIKIHYGPGTTQYKVPTLPGQQWRIWMHRHDYHTLLHEMGHVFGLNDTYIEGSTRGCTSGQPSSIMCQDDLHSGWRWYQMQMLSADDVRGVRDRFCSMYSSYCDSNQLAHRYGDRGGSTDVYYCPKSSSTEAVGYHDKTMRLSGSSYNPRGHRVAYPNKVRNLRGLRVTWGTDLDSFQAKCSFIGQSSFFSTTGTFFGKERQYKREWQCRSNYSYVTEIRVDRDRSDPQSIQLVCSDGSKSPVFGKQKPLPYSYKCPSNYRAAKGFTIRHDRDIDAIGLVCGIPDGGLFGG